MRFLQKEVSGKKMAEITDELMIRGNHIKSSERKFIDSD